MPHRVQRERARSGQHPGALLSKIELQFIEEASEERPLHAVIVIVMAGTLHACVEEKWWC